MRNSKFFNSKMDKNTLRLVTEGEMSTIFIDYSSKTFLNHREWKRGINVATSPIVYLRSDQGLFKGRYPH